MTVPRRWLTLLLARGAAVIAAGLGVMICGAVSVRVLCDPSLNVPPPTQASLIAGVAAGEVLLFTVPPACGLTFAAMLFGLDSRRFTTREKRAWVPAAVLLGPAAAAPLLWVYAGRLERGELAGGVPESGGG